MKRQRGYVWRAADGDTPESTDPITAADLVKLLAVLDTSGEPLALDTETGGLVLFRDRVRLIQIGTASVVVTVDLNTWRPVEGAYDVDWSVLGLRQLKALLENPNRSKILHNAAFDLNMLLVEGVSVDGSIFDTLAASRIINNGTDFKNDLGTVAMRLLKRTLDKSLQKANWMGELTPSMITYAAQDVAVLPPIATALYHKLRRAKISDTVSLLDVFKLEMNILQPVARMQYYGFPFNQEKAYELLSVLEDEEEALKSAFLDALDETLRVRHPENPEKWVPRDPDGTLNLRKKNSGRGAKKIFAGFNPGSGPQMTTAFTDAGIVLPPKPPKKTGGPSEGLSLDQNLLAFLRLDYPLVDAYMTWKTAHTQISSVTSLISAYNPTTGCIHSRYNSLGADTGRMSADGPNLQQVNRSKRFRELFAVGEGESLIIADFSQIELRVAAEFSKDARMLAAYKAERDLHAETASLLAHVALDQVTAAMRSSAKAANFGLLFGSGPKSFQRQAVAQYGINMTLAEATRIVAGFRTAYPQLYAWQRSVGSDKAKAVFTRYGRRRMLVGRFDTYTRRLNTPIQGTAGDIMKIALAMMYHEIKPLEPHVRIIGVVHDEVILRVTSSQVNYWLKQLPIHMESAGKVVCRLVPIGSSISSGQNWAEAK